MLLLDGLLDPPEDLHLLSLTLKTRTHSALTYQSLVRPPTLSPSTHAPQLPPPPVAPTTPAALLAHRHISSGNATLHVPTLRVPWASALVDALFKHLGLRLRVSSIRPPPCNLRWLMRVLQEQDTASDDWQNVQRDFYGTLSPEEDAYNAYVLNYIRQVMPPLALQRVAVCIKLNFITNLQRFLRHTVQPSTCTSVGSARSSVRRRPGITVRGYWTRNVNGIEHAYLLHGVPIPRDLVPNVAAILREKYGVHVQLDTARVHPLRGSLVSLSNAGTALMDGPNMMLPRSIHDVEERFAERISLRIADTRRPQPPPGRGPLSVADMNAYLKSRYGISWRQLCEELIRDVGCGEEVRTEVERVREELVASAIRLEVVGAPLSRICAFVLVQSGGDEAEQYLTEYSEEYREILKSARGRVEKLETGVAECF